MEIFSVLTLEIPGRRVTVDALVTMPDDVSRSDVYREMRKQVIARHGKKFAEASVLCFTAEPNSIGR